MRSPIPAHWADVKITDTEAFANARLLVSREYILAESSSGGAPAAALKRVENGARDNIVVTLPDRGDSHFSKGRMEPQQYR